MEHEFLNELFAPFGKVVIRNMFGGIGVFHRNVAIALVVQGSLLLKADEGSIPDFEAEGMSHREFIRKDGKSVNMGYWHVPEWLLDEPDEFAIWAAKAFEAAARADAAKPVSKRKLQEL